MCDYIHDTTNATGVYIGKLVNQKKPITEDAGENEDLDETVPKVIQYIYADKSHDKMINVVLSHETAPMSHSVFNFSEPAETPPAEAEVTNDNDETLASAVVEQVKTEDILDTFQHVYVPEVVREQKMWFQTVPRLGAFMSVPIIYESCLSDEALDSAISDYLKVTAENERLEKELEIHDADQQIKADAAAANGEAFEKEVREIEKLEFQPFNSSQKNFLICIDTMG